MQDATVTVLGAVAIIIANIIIVLQNRRQNNKVNKVSDTLTKNNGGDHVKDQLDRIEGKLKSLDDHDNVQMRLLSKLNGKFTAHLEWSEEMKTSVIRRLDDLEASDGQG